MSFVFPILSVAHRWWVSVRVGSNLLRYGAQGVNDRSWKEIYSPQEDGIGHRIVSMLSHPKASDMHPQLRRAYEDYVGAVRTLPTSLRKKASAPLLLSIREEWSVSANRLLIVGQETNGWTSAIKTKPRQLKTLEHFCKSASGIAEMVHAYDSFDFAQTYSHRNSAFWRAFRHLEENIAEAKSAAMWTNLFRVDVGGSVVRGCDDEACNHLRRVQAGLLKTEVKVLKPTVVIFFSGPTYDQEIAHAFSDSRFEQAFPDRPEREIAVVRSALLPVNSFRIYHPNYLQRSRRWSLIDRLAVHIRESKAK